ncbi:hypothetical protein J5N97_027559 [Dioscorea zingiberensis]|uniref:Uncharacterized protein n=1 Tax=Dioscorea zingiberensis TaxID=325984 RepID=A0A9D5H7Q8_9LILI|nr:hypothetical protein J5N97_027559 [Dioscorea zingiberensis]
MSQVFNTPEQALHQPPSGHGVRKLRPRRNTREGAEPDAMNILVDIPATEAVVVNQMLPQNPATEADVVNIHVEEPPKEKTQKKKSKKAKKAPATALKKRKIWIPARSGATSGSVATGHGGNG